MKVGVVTLFPELFASFLEVSFVGRAIERGVLQVHLEALRAHGLGNYATVDDTPYGGGSGMVMRVDCVVAAMESAERALGGRAHRVLLTPQGRRLDQTLLGELATKERVLLVCGRYEGFDERTRQCVDSEVSLGDFVLTGGEVAAMAIVEGTVRLLPGVLGNDASPTEESFGPDWGGLLEYPQYTRPAEFRGMDVPDVLKSGDHKKIAQWRREQALARTRERRPDLLEDDE
ncbi:MAG: tRNA (guanosine(37)-N1)-methyltransferase TrmD [Myxococcales bacterium]|nr:tRNA (guanosine(37)-N1)-methyltransferase TrmD [Myxococcales bacterium]MCB9577505.1 tRNA (guanosine(37)-N1)-methyltransferase TrmD [Polyangiaceae bacterium]